MINNMNNFQLETVEREEIVFPVTVNVSIRGKDYSLSLLTECAKDRALVAAYQQYQHHFPEDRRKLTTFLAPDEESLREVEKLAREGRWSPASIKQELQSMVAKNKDWVVDYWQSRIEQPVAPSLENLLSETRARATKV